MPSKGSGEKSGAPLALLLELLALLLELPLELLLAAPLPPVVELPSPVSDPLPQARSAIDAASAGMADAGP